MRFLRDISRNSSPCNPGSKTIRQLTQVLRHFTPDPPQFYSADTQTSTLGRRLFNHNFFWKQKILKFFCKRTNKIQGSTMQSLKTLKPFEVTSPLRKQTSNLWMLLVCLQKKKTWESLDCKTVVFLSKSVKKSVKRAVRVLRARSARASFSVSPQVSLSVFSLVPDLLFDRSRVHEYAKIRTV